MKIKQFIIIMAILVLGITGCGSKKEVEETVDKLVLEDETVEAVEREENQTVNKSDNQKEALQEKLQTLISNYENSENIRITERNSFDNYVISIEKISNFGVVYKVSLDDTVKVEAYKENSSNTTYVRNLDTYFEVTDEEINELNSENNVGIPQTRERYFTREELNSVMESQSISWIKTSIEDINNDYYEIVNFEDDGESIRIKLKDETMGCDIEINIGYNDDKITEVYGIMVISSDESEDSISATIEYNESKENIEVPQEIKDKAIKVNSVSCFILDVRED